MLILKFQDRSSDYRMFAHFMYLLIPLVNCMCCGLINLICPLFCLFTFAVEVQWWLSISLTCTLITVNWFSLFWLCTQFLYMSFFPLQILAKAHWFFTRSSQKWCWSWSWNPRAGFLIWCSENSNTF